MSQTYVISEPRKQLVGEGKNAKYVVDCKELYLGHMGIQKIRGFEDFVNLEYLCLNGNKLKKINNLEANFRLKVLNAQDNQICTLKGSLSSFHNLEQLDLSNNDLRDLAKLLPSLEKFQFLTHLNLKGNPCCEEPDYRLQVVHALPGLKVLDQHVITVAERIKASANIGGDVAALTIAFGQRAPPRSLDAVPERSLLEQELAKEAARVRDVKIVRELNQELEQFSYNPHPDIPQGKSLPPNAGMRKAMESQRLHSEPVPSSSLDLSSSTRASGKPGQVGAMGDTLRQSAAGAPAGSPYHPRDVFVQYSCRAHPTQPLGPVDPKLMRTQSGGIWFERKKYETFLARKASGTLGQWEMSKKTFRL